MATTRPISDIDALYRLPLADFTAARNALAKSGGADVRTLPKPTVPAWAVNQLYWRDRSAYEALVDAADGQRRTHEAVLSGGKGDLRGAGKAHDQAVERALKSTLAILAADGHPVTDATRQGVLTTLRALPSDEPPGRLTRTLQPGGFEMLAGLTVSGRAAVKPAARAPAPAPAPKPKARGKPGGAARARSQVRLKARIEEATRKLKVAEQAARREEFEAARSAREAEKADRRAAEARAAFETAREALEEAEAGIPAAVRARDAAARRAAQASAALDAARAALENARAQSDE